MKAYVESNPPIKLSRYLAGFFYSGNNFARVILTSRGRDAIQLAINSLDLKNNDLVLSPALTCDTVTGVFSSNCQTTFYDLRPDYSIDVSILERLLNSKPEIKAVYVIHYFGFIHRNIEQISALCKKYGILMIEDHAHSAFSDYNEGLSDIQIFSFRKLLPTADGGGIRINKKITEHKFLLKHRLIANIKGLSIAFKRIISLYSSSVRRSAGKLIQLDINRLNSGNTKIEPLPVSVFGKGIIRSSDLGKISSIRREQYLIWKELLDPTPFMPLFPDLGSETVPFGFPIQIQNSMEVLNHFKKFNVFLKVHWVGLPPDTEISCPVSHHLAQSSITLPIYPGLTKKHMVLIKDELLKCGVPFKGSRSLQV